MLSLRHSIGNASPLESLAKNPKSVPHFRCYASPPHTETYAHGIDYREKIQFGGVQVSFHSAGHILGSAQIRIEWNGEVWVVSGDYKREADPTCEPFEPVPCDVFVTEATFGTPGYRWDRDADLGREIFAWWQENAARGCNSVL